jgi:hypothetical protein
MDFAMEHDREPISLDAVPTQDLVAALVRTLSTLIERHIALAKAEALAQMKREMASASGFVAAALLAFTAWMLLVAAAVIALSNWVEAWVAALLMAAAVLAVAGGIVFGSRRTHVRRPLGRMRATLAEDVKWLRRRAVES